MAKRKPSKLIISAGELDNPIKSLEDFTRIVEGYVNQADGAGEMFCYRGVGNSQHKLIPGLYRHPNKSITADELLEYETRMISRFLNVGRPYIPNLADLKPERGGDTWGCLFFMQHFGIPTRLLDWSQNPYIALFFSLSDAIREINANKDPSRKIEAVVWVLNAVQWNRSVLETSGYKEGVLAVGAPQLDNYSNSDPKLLKAMNMFPVAMWGIHNNARISAQKGMFVAFGKSLDPMEEQVKKLKNPVGLLRKITIEQDLVGPLFKKLFGLGFTDSFIYPDLSGFASEIRRDFGFDVGGRHV